MQDAVTRLNNVRLIEWATRVTHAVDTLAGGLVEALPESDARRLQEAFRQGAARERLEEARVDVEQEMDDILQAMPRNELLQALLEVERAAQAFYSGLLDEARDPQVSDMLAGLLRQKTRHVAAVEQARQRRT